MTASTATAAAADAAKYAVPAEGVRLSGPVARPAPGTLPLRGDLAHIALASRYLAAHYVVPIARRIGNTDIALLLQPLAGADTVRTLPAGQPVELLDTQGDWCWVTLGPDGPSGYVQRTALAPETDRADG